MRENPAFYVTPTQSFSGLMQSIKHLDARISDSSGFGGRRYYQKSVSEGQRKYPNQLHQQHFWNFIRSATHLQSLVISCTHTLNFDLLSIDNLTALQELRLSGVQMSQDHFLKLAIQNSATIRAAELSCVQLDSGTWKSILLRLCSLPGLDHFYMDSCGYTTTGNSSMYAKLLLPPPDDPEDIETFNFEDRYSLGHLQRHVNSVRNKAGLPLYNDYDYKAAKLPPLDE